MKSLILATLFALNAEAKTFQNSYVSFEVPDDWSCLQEGVAWTCTPQNAVAMREAVIVLAAKVAGPEDNINAFLTFLKTPKKITTKVGTPMPSSVMYAQPRTLAGTQWVQAQHLGSEIQDYYSLYLATVKDQLAILVTFNAERANYQKYNPIFDRAMKSLKIVANQQQLFPKGQQGGSGSDVIGINVQPAALDMGDMMPPPEKKPQKSNMLLVMIAVGALLAAAAVFFLSKRKKISPSKSGKPRAK